MRRFLLPTVSSINEVALRNLYARVSDTISSQAKRDAKSVMEEVLGALKAFYGRLGKPGFVFKEIMPDDPIIAEDFVQMLRTIVDDINASYEEVTGLRDSAISAYNYASLHVAELGRRSDEVSGLVADVRLMSGQMGEEVLVFTDGFHDESKTDPSFPLEYLEAQVMPGQAALTLNRVGTVTASEGDVDLTVAPLGPYSREPNQDNEGRFYEGHFYAFLGSAEPEGGAWHLTEKLIPGSTDGITQESFQLPNLSGLTGKAKKKALAEWARDFIVPGGEEAKFIEQVEAGLYNDKFTGANKDVKFKKFVNTQRAFYHKKDRRLRKQWMYYAENPDKAETAGIDLTPDAPLTPDNYTVVDEGADSEGLKIVRNRMIDGNPASYWQCEVVRTTNVIQDYVKRQVENQDNAEVPADVLRELAASREVDKEDLEIEIVATFAEPRTLNWITLDPMVFDDGAFLEVTDVSTSPDMETTFSPVESFVSREYSNVLTDEANSEVPKDLASALLAPNRFSYRGQGVWPFAARNVQRVRIRLKQRTPVPNPFERLVLEAERTLTNKVR